MRPTLSIIAFTVLSGFGYGLWGVAGVAIAFGRDIAHPLAALAIGFALVASGLLASLGHLGRPSRAWRALSQWRSSWLSREGVSALIAFVPAIALFFEIAFASSMTTAVRVAAALLTIASLMTVYCTANIYASLKPVAAWRDRRVVPVYLAIAAYGGVLLAWTLDASSRTLPPALAAVALAIAVAKLAYWRAIDDHAPPSAGRATGLERIGRASSFEAPHTEPNYLLHEMRFRIARRHSSRLRAFSIVAGFAMPALMAMLALFFPDVHSVAAPVALLGGFSGIFVERWLFFAEAKHAVAGYYARD